MYTYLWYFISISCLRYKGKCKI